MKLIEVINAREAVKRHSHDKVPFRIAYKFASFIKATETQNSFYNDKFKEIIEQHGKKDADGNYIQNRNGIVLMEGHENECKAQLSELHDTEVDMPDITFDLNDFDGMEVTTEEIIALGNFIKEN